MLLDHHARRPPAPTLEPFEPRLVLSTTVPIALTVPLDPTADQFGGQIETVQAYEDPAGVRVTFGVFDTGSSVVAFSADDQMYFDDSGAPIPVLSPGGAEADGIGGAITGDVSQPGTIWVGGIHAATVLFDDFGFPSVDINFGSDSAVARGVQTFIGTEFGSPDLPTVAGTPALNGALSSGASSSGGLAALVDMQGYKIDLSDLFPGLVLAEPDLHFVATTTTLGENTAGDSPPVTVALALVGDDNHTAPGDQITATPNPTVQGVTLVGAGATVGGQSFLFDTGSQLTILSTGEAVALGLDLANPDSVLPVQGVGGVVDIPGFTLPELDVPTSDGGVIRFTNVPVYVLDAAPGIVDGILGMNLFNDADQLLYNPFSPSGPSLSVTFLAGTTAGAGGGTPATGLPLLARNTANGQAPVRGTIGLPSAVGSSLTTISLPPSAFGAQAPLAVGAAGNLAFATTDAEPADAIAPVPPPQSAASPTPLVAESSSLRRLERDPSTAYRATPDEPPAPDETPPADNDPEDAAPGLGILAADACDVCFVDDKIAESLTDPVLASLSPFVEDGGTACMPAAAVVGAAAFAGRWASTRARECSLSTRPWPFRTALAGPAPIRRRGESRSRALA